MEVTITFNEEEHKYAINALNVNSWLHSIWEFDQWLRSECKYNENREEKEIDVIYEVRDKLREILTENSLNIEDVL
jgi:hypothetical protein